jgi:hypothetical protein
VFSNDDENEKEKKELLAKTELGSFPRCHTSLAPKSTAMVFHGESRVFANCIPLKIALL